MMDAFDLFHVKAVEKLGGLHLIQYLPVDVQNHVLNTMVLLDQAQSFLRTQTRYLVTVVAAQQNTEINKLKHYNKNKKQ